jgi:hypothetical protein
MTIKEIRTTLMTKDKVVFNIKGITEYQCIDKETNEFGNAPKLLRTHIFGKDGATSITCRFGIAGMNVTKFGPTSFTVYSFDLIGNRTRGRIKYEDVTIVTD